jgi:hypothetical protein
MIVFLALDQASFVSGAEIAIDSGMSSGEITWVRKGNSGEHRL